MAAVESIIEPEYRVNVYLDTNILLDYMTREFPLLVRTVDFLSKCPYVYLRSSHYVLFEFTENRKARLFWEKADPENNEVYDSKLSAYIKKDWSYRGKEYAEYRDCITKQVTDELDRIKNELRIDFDEHVLHEGLVYPTNSLCLQTKMSKEDCLVMVSCMNPDTDIYLDHCLLLTRDSQYYKAFNENKAQAESVFNNSGLKLPFLVRTADMSLNEEGSKYNLYDNDGHNDIECFWTRFVLQILQNNCGSQYVGTTYEYGSTETAKKCIYFKMDGASKTLRASDGLYFVFNDLTSKEIIPAPFDFWNGKRVNSLPHTNAVFPNFSFMKEDLDPAILAKLREAGNLVLYYDV